MVLNFTNVSAENPNEWIKPVKNADGTYQTIKYTFKIAEIAIDGYTDSGDEKFKFSFKTSDGKSHSETFSMSPNVAWRFKQFVDAMKAPSEFDINSLVGRYVIATTSGRAHNGKDYVQLVSWDYAQQNDTLPPIKAAKSESQIIEEEADLVF